MLEGHQSVNKGVKQTTHYKLCGDKQAKKKKVKISLPKGNKNSQIIGDEMVQILRGRQKPA